MAFLFNQSSWAPHAGANSSGQDGGDVADAVAVLGKSRGSLPGGQGTYNPLDNGVYDSCRVKASVSNLEVQAVNSGTHLK